MEDRLIHKVKIAYEAKFDYASIYGLFEIKDEESYLPSGFQIKGLKKELEFYLQYNNRVWHKAYFKVKYIDDEKELYVFIRKREKADYIQNWEVVGICECECWSEDLEDCGQIRTWLNTKVENLEQEEDWVVVMYRSKITNLLELIYDIGGRDGYSDACAVLDRELSGQQCENSVRKFTAKRIRRSITEQNIDSEKANAIIRTLNEVLDRQREKVAHDDLYR